MMKINYTQLGILMTFVSVMGCATTNTGTNPLDTVGSGLPATESAMQSGNQISQIMDAGTAVASPAGVNQIGLVDILVHRLGVSPQQALGGSGAIFQVAQSNMDPQAFASLSRSIPGMSSMLSAAPAMSGSSGLGGGLSSVMGSSGNTLGGAAALAGSFQQLNLSPDMVGKFIPVVTNYVKQTSGQASADLLHSALKAP